MNIYIDCFPSEYAFATILLDIIKSSNPDVQLSKPKDLPYQKVAEGRDELYLLKQADIIIPIITSEYLAENTEEVDNLLDKFSLRKNKSIFPLIYSPANWASKNWIVRSTIFPSSSQSFVELADFEKSVVLNDLSSIIGGVAAKSFRSNTELNHEQPKQDKVFISHASSDYDFAELLKLRLEKENIRCWLDIESLQVGQKWREEIDKGISESLAVIVIMSPDATKSQYVTYEWAFAWGKGIQILPVMLKQTALHPRLEALQYLNFTNPHTRPFDTLIKKIIEIKKGTI